MKDLSREEIFELMVGKRRKQHPEMTPQDIAASLRVDLSDVIETLKRLEAK